MGSLIGEERHSENGDSSLLMSPSKYKRRKVSGVRDFPRDCGSNTTSLCEDTVTKEIQGVDGINVNDVLKVVMKDVEGGGEKGGEICNAENGVVKVEYGCPNGVELKTSSKVKFKTEELKNFSVEKPNILEEIQILGEKRILTNDLTDVVPELPKDSEADNKSSREEGISTEQCLLPHYPIPSIRMMKKHKFPLPRRVSAVRDFPTESSCNVTSLGQNCQAAEIKSDTENKTKDIVSKKSDYTREKRSVADEQVAVAISTQGQALKGPAKLSPSRASAKESKGKKHEYAAKDKRKRSRTKAKDGAENSKVSTLIKMKDDEVSRQLTLNDNEDTSGNEEHHNSSSLSSVVGSSNERGARSMVRGTLKLFQAFVRKLLQEEETKSKGKGRSMKRVDLSAANVLKEKRRYINTKKMIGDVPGVEIGDIFSYRVELAITGIHSPLQSGIDTIRDGKQYIAISVVASGGYDNDVDNSDVLIYTGQGGNPVGADKQAENQKLARGNLALKNSIDEKNPVRVVRGFKETKTPANGDGKPKIIASYTYDGLYTVERYWHEVSHHGTLVYKFELKRIPGQRQLAWKEMKQSKKCKVREGCCVDDISEGKDKPAICAINIIDDEKPPPFTYITSMMYPDWCRPKPLTGCNCKGGCSDSLRCACAVKNGGEIPYNLNGAIVLAKPLVYECGPSCSCPPSCSNRVSQHGMKLPLEVFKTESRGWGVRCLSSISSGSFICEYIGELLDDKQAEQRSGHDEYLFDIGQNYNDTTLSDGLSALMPNMPSIATDVVENVGFTIDAERYGNIGRFINHSCSPNLYAQNVLYDHEDKRMPHIMLFAAENIPPLEELTYHYNYTIDHVFDSKGNIKRKNCYCGSAECTGRMY